MDLVRQISALALVVTLSLIGLPLPIHAADEESRVVADGRALTVHGQPLWRLRNAASGAFSLASLLGQGTGQISGVAVGNDGQALAGHTVQARHVFPGGSSTVVDTTTTDAAGQFSFTGLAADDYRVEVRSSDEVIAVASLTLTARCR